MVCIVKVLVLRSAPLTVAPLSGRFGNEIQLQSTLGSAGRDAVLAVGPSRQAWPMERLALNVLSPAKGGEFLAVVVQPELAGLERLTRQAAATGCQVLV